MTFDLNVEEVIDGIDSNLKESVDIIRYSGNDGDPATSVLSSVQIAIFELSVPQQIEQTGEANPDYAYQGLFMTPQSSVRVSDVVKRSDGSELTITSSTITLTVHELFMSEAE